MLKKIVSSPIVMLALIVIYSISLGVATFIERDMGVEFSRGYIYHNLWFILLQFVMVVNAVAIIYKRGLFRWSKFGALLFHLSFVVILLGALITHKWSEEGIMHIREGATSSVVYLADKTQINLPIEVQLDDFVLARYPGSQSPSSYESNVTVLYDGEESKHLIRMNQVMNIGNYRFFQSSYDPDERGSVLTVNYDFPGMQITYLGYLLLVLGFVITPFQKYSRFRQLNSSFKKIGVVAFFVLVSSSSYANSNLPSVPANHAKEFGGLLVQNPKGRLEPVNTWSSKIVRKIYHDTNFKGYSSDQILLNLFVFPGYWAEEPLIMVDNKEVRKLVGDKGSEYLSYSDMFNREGEYVIQKSVEKAYSLSPSERSKFDKDILALDEVINIIYQIQQGQMLSLFPNPDATNTKWLSSGDDLSHLDGKDSLFISKIMVHYGEMAYAGVESGDWSGASEVLGMIKIYQDAKNLSVEVSDNRIKAELKYNEWDIFGRVFKFYLICGAILLSLCFYQLLKGIERFKKVQYILIGVIATAFLVQTIGFILRWYISSYPPWSNSYETMIFMGWGVVAIGLYLSFRAPIITALASILAGVLLFVSSLNWMNPDITPLVPVLQSYWLMLHVAVIMMGYGFFFVSALIGMFNLVLSGFIKDENKKVLVDTIKKCTVLNEMAMIIGTVLMCIGIFLGAVWANESWGRYWGWDPKETWALITMMVYTGVLHMRFIPKLNSIWLFNVKSVWSILSVLMTYFGVNYYLSGLHSYGNSGGELLSIPVVIGVTLLVLLTVWSLKSRNKLS